MQLVPLETMVFWKESHEKGERSEKILKNMYVHLKMHCKTLTGSLHIEWAPCVAATQF